MDKMDICLIDCQIGTINAGISAIKLIKDQIPAIGMSQWSMGRVDGLQESINILNRVIDSLERKKL